MVSSVFSLLNYELPDTFIASTPQFWNYVQAVRHRAGDGLYADFGVNVVHGVVWFWLLEQWRAVPKELWAWKCVTIWTVGHYYNGGSIWVPSLLLFDFWEYKDDPARFLDWRVMTSVIDPQPVPFTTIPIASRLFGIFRNSGDSESARMCRLVCRDWASECAVPEPKEWRVEDGVVWHWVETAWRVLPTRSWAWTPGPFADEWWVEKRCHQQWFPKLLHLVDSGSIDRSCNHPSTLVLPLSTSRTFRQSRFLTATTLPPELFQYICNAADGGSWSSRLVCQYWNRQCTPHVLRHLDIKESPERIRALWRHRADPTFKRHLKVIENIPLYYRNSKFPWIHLLSQTSTSTQSVWKIDWGDTSEIAILGPFSGGHRTMRSVHFALPRSPPRALSRGIKKLHLDDQIGFRRYEDLLHLVCELPDLEVLESHSTFGSLPTELPRRRPRTNRNKLRICNFGLEYSQPLGATAELVAGMPDIALYMSVYDATSFFSEAEIVLVLALLKTAHTRHHKYITTCYSHDPQHHSQILDFDCHEFSLPFLTLHILRDSERHVHTTISVGVDCSYQNFDKGQEKGLKYWKDWKWIEADAQFREDTAPLRHVQFVLGFYDRRQLKHFVKTVLEEDPPAIFRDTTLRYGVWDENAVEAGVKDKDGDDCEGAWRQASLDSEELTGKPRRRLPELYS